MSIWVSVGEPVRALNADDDAANYRAEGQPTVGIDVATAGGYHDHIRLAVWDDVRAVHVDAVLSLEAARRLRDMLDVAAL